MKAQLLAVLISYMSRYVSSQSGNYLELPPGFSIGASTSAYQVEGAWRADDKSLSAWDVLTHTSGNMFNGDTGDIACDSFHKYKEDVQLLKRMGLTHYRFSISWPRVLPDGTPDRISRIGIQYYKNLINELLKNDIEPHVTLHHFDDVASIMRQTGGWRNESMIQYFADYARVMFRELGPRVRYWGTINEIDIYCRMIAPTFAPVGIQARDVWYSCGHNMLKAHAMAYRIYDQEFRPTQHGKIGLVVQPAHFIPLTQYEANSAELAFTFEARWIMDPVFSKQGDYPRVMRQTIDWNSRVEGLPSSRLPRFSPEWIDFIRGSSDYLGLNFYITQVVGSAYGIHGEFVYEPVYKTIRWPGDVTGIGWPNNPQGLRAVLRKLRYIYDNPTVYILENGSGSSSGLIDVDRISYLHSHLREVLLAIREGCDIRAYTVWSLLDNFQLRAGYKERFGLVHVDFNDPNRTRTMKLSGYWLKSVNDERKLLPYGTEWFP